MTMYYMNFTTDLLAMIGDCFHRGCRRLTLCASSSHNAFDRQCMRVRQVVPLTAGILSKAILSWFRCADSYGARLRLVAPLYIARCLFLQRDSSRLIYDSMCIENNRVILLSSRPHAPPQALRPPVAAPPHAKFHHGPGSHPRSATRWHGRRPPCLEASS
jgi:hypothetical protein